MPLTLLARLALRLFTATSATVGGAISARPSRRMISAMTALCWVPLPVAAAPDAGRTADVATALLAQLDLTGPDLTEVAALAGNGDAVGALRRWRDQVVLRLRRHDFGEFGWHSYALHQRPAGAVDMLTGVVSREKYLSKPDDTGFLDVFGMAGRPGTVEKVNWFVDVNAALDWGNPKLAALDTGQKLRKTDYANFEFFKAFTGRYWKTGNEAYLQKALELMADFARNHRRNFWAAYAKDAFSDKEVRELYRCDWRLNTNGLAMGWRAKNFLKNLAGLCKCLSADKPTEWADVLKPVTGRPTREEFDRIPADQLAEIALSLMRDHSGKLLWFCLDAGAVPNQRAEGLKALAFMSAIFPDFKTAPQLADYVGRGYEDFLAGNFLPDGGSLEQSFNYNTQDKEGLEELVRFFGDGPPPYAQRALERVEARRRVDDGLQTPLGGLPQVGNHHAVLGKTVWESDDAAARYRAEDLHGKRALRPQPYSSKAFPYSGFYAMRTGWGMDDLYLFFMAGRPQRGHSMRDNNAIQVTAYGRQLVVCGGSPTYGNFRNEDARGADFYLSEASSLKNNTVLVDGRSQAKNAPKASRGYKTPVLSRWHTSPRFDLVDGHYDLGYCEHENGRNVNTDMSVEHYRCVVFLKAAKLWLIQDRMVNTGDKPHQYTQVWNFLPRCEDKDWTKAIAGFREDQFELDSTRGRFRTTDPTGPNIEFRHFGPRQLEYRKYFGNRDPWLGWFAAGIGDARPAPDVQVKWRSEDSDTLVTLLVPMDTGQASPIVSAESMGGRGSRRAGAGGFDAALRDSTRLRYLCAAEPTDLDLTPAKAVAKSLLVCAGLDDNVSGIALGCRSLTVAGKSVVLTSEDFEFAVGPNGEVELLPFFLPEVPVIDEPLPFANVAHVPPVAITGAHDGLTIRYTTHGADPTAEAPAYTHLLKLERECVVKARLFRGAEPLPLVAIQGFSARKWRLREPDLTDAKGLEPGLRYERFQFDGGYIRLYDLMLRQPKETGECESLDLDAWEKRGGYGVKWQGYLRLPRDGIYHFHCHAPSGAHVFLHNPRKDLEVPAVVHPTYVTKDATGSIALKAGLHQLRVEYVRFPQNPNELTIEVEGPGIVRQPLPAAWLHRSRRTAD